MADITIISRLVAGISRNVNLQNNSLVVGSLKVGSSSPTELTKAILDQLIDLTDGGDAGSLHHHDAAYFTQTQLGSVTGVTGSDRIGDDNTYTNFTPAAATVKGALSGIDSALASAGGGLVKVTAADTTSGYLNSKIVAGAGLASSVLNGGGDEDLNLAVNVDDSTIEINADALRVKAGGIADAQVSASAAIAYSKLALTGSIVDADVNASAAIAYSKLALTGSIVNADINASAAIAYSKLALTSSIVNADISGSAAIAYSKLALTGSIVNADIASGAAIAVNKLAALTANRATATDASGFLVASAATDTELGYLTGVTSNIQTQFGDKLSLSGGTMTGILNMGGFKIASVGSPTNAGDATTKAYVDALVSAGNVWLDPVLEPDLVDDSLSTPPGSPVSGAAYLIGSSPTGAWSGLAGRLVYWDGASWVDILGRVVAIGDRFGITIIHGAGSEGGNMATRGNQIAELTNATPGSYAYTFTTPSAGDAIFVSEPDSQHFGKSYTYNGTDWIQFGGPGATNAGIGLQWDGNTLNVKLGAGIVELPSDEVGIDVHTSGGLFLTVDNSAASSSSAAQLAVRLDGSTLAKSASGLKVADGGISNTQVSGSAAIAYSKLNLAGSIVNADVATGAAIAYSKLALTGSIVDADVNASAAIAYSKLALTGSIVNADINSAAAIAYSKLSLTGSIVNADISGSAAIAYSKLSLGNSILDADINASAAIAYSKLALTSSIVNADIAAAAAIARSKLASGTANHVVINDGSGVLSSEARLSLSRFSTGASGSLLIGQGAGDAAFTAMSGDVTIDNTGVATVGAAAKSAVYLTFTAGEALTAGDIVYLSTTVAGEVLKADSDALATCEGVVGIADQTVSAAASVRVQVAGQRAVSGSGFVAGDRGKRMYVGGTAGAATPTAPSATNSVVFLIGHLVNHTAGTIVIAPSLIAVND